jgi:iron complex outermembrane recepter protein
MKNSPAARLRPHTLLKASPVAAAVAVMLLGTGAVQAQTSGAAPAGEVVTITGIRRGIESAINVKKNADSIVESVSAEDIGKLPDSSIAESIARLPGLAAQRVNGRATEINIRGLSGDFANTLLNGRETVSTGNNRSVQFDQFPSELIAGVDIYKTPTASLVGQGLSGTLDLKTVRPLSFGQRTVSINVRGERNGEGTPFKGDGNRAAVTYIDQFADRTVGVVLGIARLTQKTTKTQTETYDTANTTSFPNVNGGANFTFNQGFKYFVNDTEETRTGAMGAIEFKPNKNISSMIDLFYSKFEKEFVKRGIELQVNDSWKSGSLAFQSPTLNNAVIQNGRLISGVWGNVNPLSRTIWEPREDDLSSAGWNTRWKFTPTLTGVLDISTSRAKSKERITELEAGVYDTVNNRPLPGTVTVNNYNEVTAFQYNHGDPSIVRLTDPESWGQNGYDKTISTDDKMRAVRLQFELDLEGPFQRVTAGAHHGQRDKTKGATEAFVRLANRTNDNPGVPIPGGAGTLAIPGSASGTVNFDPGSVFNSGVYRLDSNVNADILNKGWTVNEKVTTGFVRADVETELLGKTLRGNVGAQVIHTDQQSTAPRVLTSGGSFVLQSDGITYTDVLPSLNLTMELGGDQFLRFGAGKQQARPRMDFMRAFVRSEVNGSGRWEGSGGNPRLEPFRATALDLSYEKYFGVKGYVSAAAFYKDLDTYILEVRNRNFDFTGLPNLSGRPPTQGNIGDFTAPINGKGGTIQGVELAVSVPLNILVSALDGFGIQASYSNTSSKIKPFGDGDVRPLPGLSKQVAQLTAYYEKFGFSARVATRKRGSFLGETEQFGADRGFTFIRGETLTDLQLGYDFGAGMLKGLSVLLQVNNVGNETYREYNNNTLLDTKLDENGRTVLFGVNYKF